MCDAGHGVGSRLIEHGLPLGARFQVFQQRFLVGGQLGGRNEFGLGEFVGCLLGRQLIFDILFALYERDLDIKAKKRSPDG